MKRQYKLLLSTLHELFLVLNILVNDQHRRSYKNNSVSMLQLPRLIMTHQVSWSSHSLTHHHHPTFSVICCIWSHTQPSSLVSAHQRGTSSYSGGLASIISLSSSVWLSNHPLSLQAWEQVIDWTVSQHTVLVSDHIICSGAVSKVVYK